MDYHRQVGQAIQANARTALRDVTGESLMSGVVILLSKQTWHMLGGFQEGFLGVDNAIHQAARDRGCRVYLMEGVYVYHWYRADAISHAGVSSDDFRELGARRPQAASLPNGFGSTKNGTAAEEHPISNGERHAALDAVDDDIPFWRRVAVTGHRILLIGNNVASAAADINTRQPAALTIVEMGETTTTTLDPDLNGVQVADDEGNGVELADGSFDAIIAVDAFEKTRRPERILRKLRRWLAPDGRLTTSFDTVRSLPIVEGLLAGRWRACAGKTEAGRPIRFVTRREVEKILYRTGFAAELVEPIPGPGHADWLERGRPGRVRVDRLSIAGLPPDEVEEFHSRGFLLEVMPAPVPDFGVTSIVIVTFNQIEYTQRCVESIRRMTDEAVRADFRRQRLVRWDGRISGFAYRCQCDQERRKPGIPSRR